MMFQTEFAFVLPQGYVDEEGNLHREGTMRLATAEDEVLPHRDSRVIANPMYLPIIILSRVVTRLEGVNPITSQVIMRLYAADYDYLQTLYERVNRVGRNRVAVTCPYCEKDFEVELSNSGE